MARFVVVMRQRGEGCDYTIGCGLRAFEVEAEDTAAAFHEVCDLQDWGPGYLESAEDMDSVTIYEVASSDSGLTFASWLRSSQAAEAEAKHEAKLKAKRAQLDRLKAELGEA